MIDAELVMFLLFGFVFMGSFIGLFAIAILVSAGLVGGEDDDDEE